MVKPRLRLVSFVLLVAAAGTGCAARMPAQVAVTAADALTAVRVKTAIVNDVDLGALPIDVSAVAGVVTLEGIVLSADQRDCAVALAEGVPGVARVVSALTVGDPDPLAERGRPRLPALAPRPVEGPRRLIGAGAVVRLKRAGGGLQDRIRSISPVFRFPPGTGLGPAVEFNSFDGALEHGTEGQPALAALRLRPVMAGLEYNVVRDRLTFSASLVAGYSFNGLNVDATRAGPGRAIDVENSLAARPGVSVWFDATERVGLNLRVGYVVSRPKVTFGSDQAVTTERIRVNAVVVSAGLAYWIF